MEDKPVDGNGLNLRIGFGVVLLVLGIAGAIWIASLLVTLVHDLAVSPEEIPFVSKLAEMAHSSGPLSVDNKDFQLPYGVYFILGTIIYLFILGIATGLVKVCIDGGVHLLHDKVDRVLSRLNKEIKKIKKPFSSRKEE